MPVGTIVHNIELKIGKGGQLARSAGTTPDRRRGPGLRHIRLNRASNAWCTAVRGTIGAVSNPIT